MSKKEDIEVQDVQDEETQEESEILDSAEWHQLVSSFNILYPKGEQKDSAGLTRKQKLIAYAVSLGWQTAAISKLMHIHRNTVKNWMKDPKFVAFVNACSYVNPIAKVNDFIKNELLGAAKKITEIYKSDDPNIKPEVQLQAAKTIFNQALGDPAQTKTVTIRDLYNRMDEHDKKRITDEGDILSATESADSDIKVH